MTVDTTFVALVGSAAISAFTISWILTAIFGVRTWILAVAYARTSRSAAETSVKDRNLALLGLALSIAFPMAGLFIAKLAYDQIHPRAFAERDHTEGITARILATEETAEAEATPMDFRLAAIALAVAVGLLIVIAISFIV